MAEQSERVYSGCVCGRCVCTSGCVLLILNFYFIFLADCIFWLLFPSAPEAAAAAHASRRREASAADLMPVHLLIILRFHHNKCC